MEFFSEKECKQFWCEIFGHNYQPRKIQRNLEELKRQNPRDDLYLVELLCTYYVVWKCSKCGKIERTERKSRDANPFFAAYLEGLRESRKRLYGKI